MKPRQSSAAFTLIELLVVISIIALLIGILLPALGAAREAARGGVCQANMKSLTTAFYTYATDNKFFTPGRSSIPGPAEADKTSWMVNGWLADQSGANGEVSRDLSRCAIWPYLGGSVASTGPGGGFPTLAVATPLLAQVTEPGTGPAAVLACPSDDNIRRSSGVSYSGNSFIWDGSRSLTNGQPLAGLSKNPAKVGKVGTDPGSLAGLPIYNSFLSLDVPPSPSELIMLVDEGAPDDNAQVNPAWQRGVNDGLFEAMSVFPEDDNGKQNTAGDKSKWYHGDNAAFGFADGHGELRSRDDPAVTNYNPGRVFPDRSFRGYGKLWDPLGESPENPRDGLLGG